MEILELIETISRGEDSRHQFKIDFTNIDAVTAELVAFSNAQGGQLFIGVDDDGTVKGLTSDAVRRLNQLISNSASQGVRPPINPQTENISHPDGLVLVVTVPEGLKKPHMDKNGIVWVKNGSDKRRATSQEELLRMFQEAGALCADEMKVLGSSVSDVDVTAFAEYYEKRIGSPLSESGLKLEQVLANMKLMEGDSLNLTGCLLFLPRTEWLLPMCMVKAVAFPGTQMEDEHYLDSRNITGRLKDVFEQTVSFLMTNTRRLQGNQSVNSVGEPEFPRIVWEELVANALLHRNCCIADPVRVMVFSDRVEIIGPGHLPNHLTIENVKTGTSNTRNQNLSGHASWVLPYRGIGSGILRVLKECPEAEFVDDRSGNHFRVIIRRK